MQTDRQTDNGKFNTPLSSIREALDKKGPLIRYIDHKIR